MSMFANLGPALVRQRKLRRKSQTQVARSAQIGKSQLSKYEAGKEPPKLESLERVLTALDIGFLAFFYTVRLLDGEADRLPKKDQPEDVQAAFHRLIGHLVELHRQVVVARSRRGETPGEER